mgnify:CR=1 FL=1|jgi:hypothetical protein|nr:MAG TPA: hypothetical protein [Caudoviricetes sp.]
MNKLDELIRQLSRMKVQTGSLVCLGCGLEHNCGIHGCAVLRQAVSAVCQLDELRERLRRGGDDAALVAALRCSSGVPTGSEDCEHCKYGQRIGDASDGDPLPDELIAIADEWTCDCDRIAVDAAKRLEQLMEVMQDG